VLSVPEIAYRYIYPRDVAGPTFEIMSRSGSTADTAVAVTRQITGVPKDRVLCLSNLAAFINPGATQAGTSIVISGFTQAAASFRIVSDTFVIVADLNHDVAWAGQVFLPGRGDDPVLTVTGNFDAGVNSNSLSFAMQGVVIPRGNSAAF